MKKTTIGRAHRAIVKPSTAKRKIARLRKHTNKHSSDGQAINAIDRLTSIK